MDTETRTNPAPSPQDDGHPDFRLVLANTVHDMKNSVGVLLAALDDLDLRCAGEACASRDQLARLRYEGRRLSTNLMQVLALYRMEETGYTPNIGEHDACELLEECLLEHAGMMEAAGMEMELVCEEDELPAFFDRELVAGLIGSVINNAWKYSNRRIRLRARRRRGYLELAVEDDGRGYPESMLTGTGNEPDSAHSGICFRSGSTGLGLYFARRIAALHQHQQRRGFVSLDNEGIDGGGRFTLHLP
ncbi:MAG TPA: HAMP domain-containing histidine kinase [Gammaproteobacteria bacterium]|nr:HAMP domain-containing histidine kinase [Gammaproteobacteria bacterium]